MTQRHYAQIRDHYRAAFGIKRRRYLVGGDGSDYRVTDGSHVVADSISRHSVAVIIAVLLNFAAALCGSLDKK